MRDQVAALRNRGIPAARLDSTLTPAEQAEVLTDLEAGNLRLLYLSPERLLQAETQRILRSLQPPVPLIAVDEAHCLVEWGHGFRPDYLRLASLPRLFPDVPLLALTATATPAAAVEICQALQISADGVIQTSFARPNLRLGVTPCPAAKRTALLTKKLSAAGRTPAIVYVTRQETAESVATALQRAGIPARAYHAGLPDEYRAEAQDAFLHGDCPVMVATTAFGMGIDLPGVRSVFHFNLPRSLENYLQETGRAGRDGRTAHAEVLASAEDLAPLRNQILGDTPTPEALRLCLDCFLRQGPSPAFSRWQLSRRADIRPAVLDTVLARLELAGLLIPGPALWLTCRVKLRRRTETLTAGHPPQQQAWIRFLLLGKETVWGRIPVDLTAAAAALESDPEILAQFLRDLEIAGDLTVRPVERQETWQLAGTPSPATWFETLHRSITDQETAALRRLEEMEEFLTSTGCLSRRLLLHFGQTPEEDCGRCTRCRHPDKVPAALPSGPVRPITADEIRLMSDLVRQRLPALRHPRQLTRFLCGIPSPATLRDRLTRHEAFGLLRDLPFTEVLIQAEAAC